MSEYLKIFSLVLLTLNFANSANILGLFPFHSISHFRVYQPLLEKLAERGHHVDVFGHFPRKEPLPRYTDLSIRGSMKFVDITDVYSIKRTTLLQNLNLIYQLCGDDVCTAVTNTTVAKELKKSTKRYDLIITEIFFSGCMLGYVQIFDVPIVAVTASINMPWDSDFIGLPDNPSYIPNYFSAYGDDMDFIERLYNGMQLIISKTWYHYYAMEASNAYYQNFFKENKIHLREVVKNVSLHLVNSHFSIHGSRPVLPNFIEVGGIHIKETTVLPKEFEVHLKTDLQGVIYFSFGTLLKSELFPEEKLVPIFEVLGKLPYKVLWKGDASFVPKHLSVPDNIHFISWMPQLELLCHPNVTLFISHCGNSGVLESIYCGTPLLGLPVWADQFGNANVPVTKGTGLAVPFFELTKEKFSEAVLELLENPKYTKNAKTLSEVFRDRPISALDTAVYWTEYVIKHKGALHLRSKGADLPWYSYYCLDLIFVPIAVMLLICTVLYRLCSSIKQGTKLKMQ